MHTIDGFIFEQQLVVFGDCDEEKDGGNVLEAVNPLLPFGSLATNIEHAICEISNDESSFGDTGRLYTRTEHILVAG